MQIKSATFKKGSPTTDGVFEDGLPHIAFIGRSNVGKSSTINALTKTKGLAKTSGAPGATKHINMFLINNNLYIIDLPGYGFVKGSVNRRNTLHDVIEGYLTHSHIAKQKIVLIIDAKVGPTSEDLDMFEMLKSYEKNIIIAINKIDKLKNSEFKKNIDKLKIVFSPYVVVPYSAEKKTKIPELWSEIIK